MLMALATVIKVLLTIVEMEMLNNDHGSCDHESIDDVSVGQC